MWLYHKQNPNASQKRITTREKVITQPRTPRMWHLLISQDIPSWISLNRMALFEETFLASVSPSPWRWNGGGHPQSTGKIFRATHHILMEEKSLPNMYIEVWNMVPWKVNNKYNIAFGWPIPSRWDWNYLDIHLYVYKNIYIYIYIIKQIHVRYTISSFRSLEQHKSQQILNLLFHSCLAEVGQ